MPIEVDEQRKLDVQCEVIRLLNVAESLLTGWVLKHDPEKINQLTSPLYELCDRD